VGTRPKVLKRERRIPSPGRNGTVDPAASLGPVVTAEGELGKANQRCMPSFCRSVLALPMRLLGVTIGALSLCRTHEGALEEGDVAAAQALADVTTVAILHHRAATEAQLVNEQLTHALNSRIVLEQAKGVVAERTGLDMDQASLSFVITFCTTIFVSLTPLMPSLTAP